MLKQQKYYVVWKGIMPGIYHSWKECEAQIKGFEGAAYKSFLTEEEARNAFKSNSYPKRKSVSINDLIIAEDAQGPILNSLAVDAACSGNPGEMEYRGVSVLDKREIFYLKFPLGTNNIGEFLALVHGLSYLKKHHLSQPIYSDSVNAIGWVKAKKAKTKLERNSQTESLFQYIERAEDWLKKNTYSTQILKWDTKSWGEIPADFGRK